LLSKQGEGQFCDLQNCGGAGRKNVGVQEEKAQFKMMKIPVQNNEIILLNNENHLK